MSEREMRTLVRLLAKQLGLSWRDVTDWLREQNQLDAIEARIASGNWMGALQKLDDAALKVAADIHESYVTAGQKASDWLDGKVSDKLIRFDTTIGPVERRARLNQLEYVQGFREEANEVTRQIAHRAMVEGAGQGINPRAVARDFRDSIGLTAHQEKIVANYRRALETGNYSRAMGYELRDARADRTLRAADANGEALTPQRIDAMVEKYRQNQVAHRATTIARTEAMRNANDGATDAMRQAIDRGDIDADQLVKTWHAGPATRFARDQHQELDGTSVGVDEDFVLPSGVRMSGPGDSRGGAAEVVNCRCTSSISYSA